MLSLHSQRASFHTYVLHAFKKMLWEIPYQSAYLNKHFNTILDPATDLKIETSNYINLDHLH